MNFNAIINQRNFNTNAAKIYEIYANRLSFSEWLNLFFQDKSSAIKLNSLVNRKFKINNIKLNLSSQTIAGNDEIRLLNKINEEFPAIEKLLIDLNNFNSDQCDVLDTVQCFKKLNYLCIFMEFQKNFSISLNFPEVEEFKLTVSSTTHDSIAKFHIDCLIQNMPNLKFCYFNNVYLSEIAIEKLLSLQISKLHLYDIYCSNHIDDLFQLKSLSSIRIHGPNHHIYNIMMNRLFFSFNSDSNIKSLDFQIPSIEIYVPFKNILKLAKLEKLSFSVSITNMDFYLSLLRMLALIPKIKTNCQIEFYLENATNNFDSYVLGQSTSTTIRGYIATQAFDLQQRYPNFCFSLEI